MPPQMRVVISARSRYAEVRSDGTRTGPFEARGFVRALVKWVAAGRDSATALKKTSFELWISGDSTGIQLYHGLLCALVRAGGMVVWCWEEKSSAKYGNPKCKKTDEWPMPERVAAAAGPWPDHNLSRFADVASIELDGVLVTFRMVDYALISEGKRHDRGPPKINKLNLREPDLWIVNAGLHLHAPDLLRHVLLRCSQVEPPSLRARMVFRETTVQHFPGGGSYEQFVAGGRHFSGDGCAPVTNVSESLWRQSMSRWGLPFPLLQPQCTLGVINDCVQCACFLWPHDYGHSQKS